MEIIGCGKGHYYNPELYSSCPECAKEQGNAGTIGATEAVNYSNFANHSNDIGATEPVNFNRYAQGSNTVGVTEPLVQGQGKNYEPYDPNHNFFNIDPVGPTDPVIPGGNGMMETDIFREPPHGGKGGKGVQSFGPTMPVTMPNNPTGYAPFQPVVGWLVCIEGPAKGRDYRIHSQYNYIGRGHHMDICISGDDCISTERAAVIAYDAVEKFFSFGPSMGHNVVRVNGKMLMNAVVLNPYDELTIGKTKLLFIPLCGERFDWNDK